MTLIGFAEYVYSVEIRECAPWIYVTHTLARNGARTVFQLEFDKNSVYPFLYAARSGVALMDKASFSEARYVWDQAVLSGSPTAYIPAKLKELFVERIGQ